MYLSSVSASTVDTTDDEGSSRLSSVDHHRGSGAEGDLDAWRKGSLAEVKFEGRGRKNLQALAAFGVLDDLERELERQTSQCREEQELRNVLDRNDNINEQTALHVAVMHGHLKVVELLIKYGASIESLDVNEKTPLLYCCRYDRLAIGMMLKRKGANVNATDRFDNDGTAIAAIHGHMQMVRWMIDECLLDVNHINMFGESALHKAARGGFLEIVNFLVGQKGASTSLVGQNGTAADVAEPVGQILRILRRSDSLPSLSRSPGSSSALLRSVVIQADSPDDDSNSSVEFLDGPLNLSIDFDDVSLVMAEDDAKMNSLRARLRKSSSNVMFDLPDPSVIRAGRDTWKRRRSADELEATSLLFQVDSEAGVVIERKGAGVGANLETNGVYEPYREIFLGHKELNFYSRSLQMVATVLVASEDSTYYKTLVRSGDGMAMISLRVGGGGGGGGGGASLEKALLSALSERFPLPPKSPRTRRLHPWSLVSVDLSPLLVQYETNCGRPRTLSVGIICGLGGQMREADMMENEECHFAHFDQFMSVMQATRIEMKGFSGYNGGLRRGSAYYTRFRDFQIVFFVSTLMTGEEQRKHIGNCKVQLYYYERSPKKSERFHAQFRGNVNSYAVCVSPDSSDRYIVNAFRRQGMDAAEPKQIPDLPLKANIVRETILAKMINASASCYNFLYANRLKKVWEMEIARVIDRMDEIKPRRIRSGFRAKLK